MDDSLNAGQVLEPASEMHLPDILIPDHSDFLFFSIIISFPLASKAAINRERDESKVVPDPIVDSEGLPRPCHIVFPIRQRKASESWIDHADQYLRTKGT